MENTRRSKSNKIPLEQAEAIEDLRSLGWTIRDLARVFGVSRETVRLIGVNGADKARRAHER